MNELYVILIIGVVVAAFLLHKKLKKPEAKPTVSTITPTVSTPEPAPAVIPQPVVVGIPGNRVELSPVTAAFLASGANQGVAGPETQNPAVDLSGNTLGVGHFKQNVQQAGQYVAYSFEVKEPRTTQFWYALCTGGNAGALVTSYISNSAGVVVSETTKVLANSQSFYVACEPDTYVFHVKLSETMPIQVGVY